MYEPPTEEEYNLELERARIYGIEYYKRNVLAFVEWLKEEIVETSTDCDCDDKEICLSCKFKEQIKKLGL